MLLCLSFREVSGSAILWSGTSIDESLDTDIQRREKSMIQEKRLPCIAG